MSKAVKLVIAGVVLVAIGAAGYFYISNRSNTDSAKTTSKSASAQDSYKGTPRQDNTSTTPQGGAIDNNGSGADDVNKPGVTSEGGVIKVVGISANALIDSGIDLHGTADGLSKIQYRLIDDNTGVIAQGSLKVVDGTYSGTLRFNPTSKTGRLDVYSLTPEYEEKNNIQIPVRYEN